MQCHLYFNKLCLYEPICCVIIHQPSRYLDSSLDRCASWQMCSENEIRPRTGFWEYSPALVLAASRRLAIAGT